MAGNTSMVRVCILTGYGINCDYDTESAFNLAGAKAEKVHINDLIDGIKQLSDYHILAFPGGFSYGDDIASGRVMANKFKTSLWGDLQEFIKAGKLVIGICNGFQIMVKMGLLPSTDGVQSATLSFNDSGKFEDRWVYLTGSNSNCVFTKGIDKIYLPIRHGEGKFIAKDEELLKSIEDNNQVVFRYADNNYKETDKYPGNPNGSMNNIAALCDKTGRVFGLMPHPEAFVFKTNHPRWTRENVTDGAGLQIFKNAVEYVKKNF